MDQKISLPFFRHPTVFCYVYSRGMKSSRNCTDPIIFPDQPAAGRFYGGGDGQLDPLEFLELGIW